MRAKRTRSSILLTTFLVGFTILLGGFVIPSAEAEEPIRLHLLWTNDIHGHVGPEGARFMNPDFPPPLGGGASAARYIQKLRAKVKGDPTQGVLLVDAGDTWQGAPEGTLTEGRIMETYFTAMGFDVVVVGNHEFDKGKQVPIRMSAAMPQKFVTANIFKAGTDELVDWVEPYRVVEKAGLRIGIIGVITPATASMAFAEHVEGLSFGPVVPALEKYRDILLQDEGVDLVFAVMHLGLPYDPEAGWEYLAERVKAGEDLKEDPRGAMDVAHVVEGIPIMVGGHTHRGYYEPWIDPVTQAMVFESFGNGGSIGHAILLIDPTTKQMLGYESPRRDGTLITLFEDQWWPEEGMQAELAPYIEEARAGLDVVVGRSSVELSRRGGATSRMGILVTESMKTTVEADFAFSNTGGLRSDLSAGNLTVEDLMRVLPFGNGLAVFEANGELIRQIFERKSGRRSSGIAFSGVKVVVDPDAERGYRVLELTLLDGSPVEPDKIYRLVTSDFLMEGNSGLDFLAEIPPDQVDYTGILIRDGLALYIEANTPVSPGADDRWRENVGGQAAPYLKRGPIQ